MGIPRIAGKAAGTRVAPRSDEAERDVSGVVVISSLPGGVADRRPQPPANATAPVAVPRAAFRVVTSSRRPAVAA